MTTWFDRAAGLVLFSFAVLILSMAYTVVKHAS